MNYRPEYRHEWGQKTYYRQMHVAPLGKAEARELLTFLLGNAPSLTALKSLILARTEGTPFFMEEVVQTLVEEGALSGEHGHYRLDTTPIELHISPTVQGVLAARIDRLTADEKALLQQLSVIGRQFPVSLLERVVLQPKPELHRLLSSLQAKEFLYEQPAFPETEYLFKHALTQEVAYGTVLHEQRKALHERTGQALETLYHENLDERYGELTYHYEQSGNAVKAVTYHQLAGQQAIHRSANAEALTHLTSALTFLETLPETSERIQQEVALQLALAQALTFSKGGIPEAETAYTRARELCQQVEDSPQLVVVLARLGRFYRARDESAKAQEVADQLRQLAQRVHDPALLVLAHQECGAGSLWRGTLGQAYTHMEQALTLYDPHLHHARAVLGFDDSAVYCRGYVALALWFLGYPAQARQQAREASTLAQTLAHPLSLAFARHWVVVISQLRREVEAVHEQAEVQVTFTTEHGLPFYLACGRMWQGWARVRQGEREAGLNQLRQGLSEQQTAGIGVDNPSCSALVADAYQHVGEVERGLAVLTEALAIATRTQEHLYTPEFHRLKGELLLQDSPDNYSHAAACFQQALEVARRQEAKSWELRAATSLARLWRQQGKKADARQMLAEVYGWFTEGFDTKDLQEAKMLLEELA